MEGPSQEDLDELLVFGYASKIYRDDERAQWLENGGHLIPLLGDSSILIDRYDGRGALVDLKAFEPLLTQTPLSREELKVEAWCDLERYRDCRNEEVENNDSCCDVNQNGINDANVDGGDEKDKRCSQQDNPYDSATEDNESSEEESKPGRRDYAFVPPPGLYVPPDLILPITMKSHAVIEKTAKFIASHGTQMEIILKTKQGSNPLFNFLTLNDELHPYYKYLVTAIKTHAYKPVPGHTHIEASPHGSDTDDDEHYLHPSLAPKVAPCSIDLKATRFAEYKVKGPSAYSMLVEKIKEMAPGDTEDPLYSHTKLTLNVCQANEDDKSQPTGESLAIIEKMASYVVKNGPSFESLAGTKGDPRFKFLDPSHPHHWYYVVCKDSYSGADVDGIFANKFIPYSHETTKNSLEPQLTPVPPRPSATPPKPPPPDHANALNRMASLPPALIDKIEQLRRKTLENYSKAAEEKPIVTSWHEPIPWVEVALTQTCAPTTVQPVSSPNTEVASTAAQSQPETEEEKAETRRAERRKRAALFLEQMKNQVGEGKSPDDTTPPVVTEQAAESESSREGDEVEIIAEVHHDIPRRMVPPENSEECEVEEIGRISPKSRLQMLRKRARSVSDEDGEYYKKRHKKKKRSKSSSTSEDSESGHELRHHNHGSRCLSTHKKKSKKKKRKKDKRKSSPSFRKSKRRD